MKKLKDILKVNEVLNQIDDWDVQVSSVCIDSRKVKHRSMFIAYQGYALNGHDYISKAIDAGATTIVLDDPEFIDNENVSYVLVQDAKQLSGYLASRFLDMPSTKLKIVGVTGTNGKTTVASLLFKLFRKAEKKVGLLSTIVNKVNDEILETNLTTPDAVTIQSLFERMVDKEVEYVFMEVSSHALDQGRVNGVDFDIGVFTNITHDHLDYHKTFLEYINAKKQLFDNLKKDAYAIVNIDDTNGKVMVQNSQAEILNYALKRPAQFKTKILQNSIEGLHLTIEGHEVFLKLIGDFNAYNATAVFATATLLGLEEIEVLRLMSGLIPIEGRMDVSFIPDKNVTGIIDYSHTPDALEKALKTINDLRGKRGRLITVVGCGGDRDNKKRPLMAGIAERLSDIVVLTSDNPRNENPDDILDQMFVGVKGDKGTVIRQVDRKEAIKIACLMAQKNDVILIAGKGHEKYQEIKGVKIPFSDKEIFNAFMH